MYQSRSHDSNNFIHSRRSTISLFLLTSNVASRAWMIGYKSRRHLYYTQQCTGHITSCHLFRLRHACVIHVIFGDNFFLYTVNEEVNSLAYILNRCLWWKLADSRDWQCFRVLRRDAYSLCIFLTVRIAPLSCFRAFVLSGVRAFVTKKVKREKYRGLDNESESRRKMRVQKWMWWKMETASRHAKCFDVLCVCVNENIFQKGDILLVRNDKNWK